MGDAHVLTDPRKNRRFRKGYRYGEGAVLAVVRPGTLLEQWRVFKAAIEAGRIVIMQAANTGLNGGSTPYGDDYDREVVLINTMRIDRIDLLKGGEQVLALAGSTLHRLEKLIRPLGREPHSVIGSTTIGASIVGGVCNNSGGALIRRGPAFTQLALYARVGEDGSVSLVNNLGIELGNDPEDILARLDSGRYGEGDVWHDTGKLASDPDYSTLLRDIEAPGPARFNNDPRLLYEAAGSAGKLCVFAVRLDTFPSSGPSKVFYIGSNDHMERTNIRRHILSRFNTLPVAGEYLHQDAYRLAEDYGKDLYLLIKHAGTERIPTAFALKSRFDAITGRLGLGTNLSDKILQVINGLLPTHPPARMNAFRDRYSAPFAAAHGRRRDRRGPRLPAVDLPAGRRRFLRVRRGGGAPPPSATATPSAAARCAIAPCMPTRWRTSSRWIWRYRATRSTGAKRCPMGSSSISSAASRAGTSCARCSTTIMRSRRAPTGSRSSTRSSPISTAAASSSRPSTMSAISRRPSPCWPISIARSTPPTQ